MLAFFSFYRVVDFTTSFGGKQEHRPNGHFLHFGKTTAYIAQCCETLEGKLPLPYWKRRDHSIFPGKFGQGAVWKSTVDEIGSYDNDLFFTPSVCMAARVCLKNRSMGMIALQLIPTLMMQHSIFMLRKLHIILEIAQI